MVADSRHVGETLQKDEEKGLTVFAFRSPSGVNGEAAVRTNRVLWRKRDAEPPVTARSDMTCRQALFFVVVLRKTATFSVVGNENVEEEMIRRDLAAQVLSVALPKAVVISGPRGAGKTTLLQSLIGSEFGGGRFLRGDDPADVRVLSSLHSREDVEALLASADTIVIDEAQRVPSIGLITKILADANEKTKLLLAASASLELARGALESAVGRVVHRRLWPLSVSELERQYGRNFVEEHLERLLVFGTLPEVVVRSGKAAERLTSFVADRLLSAALELGRIRNLEGVRRLVTLLAQKIGRETTVGALAREAHLSQDSVARWLYILERCFVIRSVSPFTGHPPDAFLAERKFYFCDVGVRNAVISDFRPFSARNDAAALWENFFLMERLKKHDLERNFRVQQYQRERGVGRDARTETGLDAGRAAVFIERHNSRLEAYECRLIDPATKHVGPSFLGSFPDIPLHVVSPQNCRPYFQLR